MANVTLDSVSKRYGSVKAVDNLSVEIRDGEFMALVGPSGCGKSTALRMIAGLEEITAGTIKIGERVVNNVEPRDRDIAMVFQNYALYPHMSVYENMAFGLKLRKVPKAVIAQKVQSAAELLGIETLLERKPGALSGGQRQRVALGRAIVREPQVFLMDEPLSNLDAKLRVQTRAELTKLHRRLGITTIYVTHDQVEAMTMGDRMAVMKDGVLQQCDTPMNIYSKPANVFVAGFVGTPAMNFLPGTIRIDQERHYVHCVNCVIRLANNLPVNDHQKVVVGIRPADLSRLSKADSSSKNNRNVLMAVVDVCEPMGDSSTLYLKAGETDIVALADGDTSITEGDEIQITLDSARVHVFDPDTELAIR